jgi:tRNA(His) 5'-end guanylyltransferase
MTLLEALELEGLDDRFPPNEEGLIEMSLGNRMKVYEAASERIPRFSDSSWVVLRLDGRSFSRYTSGLEKPFDKNLQHAFEYAALKLAADIGGLVQAIYGQSDEVSIFLRPTRGDSRSQRWFGGQQRKLLSVAASVFSNYFNHPDSFNPHVGKILATFDCRALELEDDEVLNYLIWRQNDCRRNGILNNARYYYSQKQIHGKSTAELLDILVRENRIYSGSLLHTIFHGWMYALKSGDERDTLMKIDYKESFTSPYGSFRDVKDELREMFGIFEKEIISPA